MNTDGFSGPALIVGSPTSSPVTNLELYLIFPLNNEESTITLVRGTMATGGIVLLGLLAAIALLVARQIVLPVRSASRIAERFAEGHLTERMPVRGEDDMARLAVSFNDMAESLSRQITQLEEFGNLQRRFTSDVSHELRTPLTTVRMAADLIYDHSEDLEPALRRSTELMVSELDRFETLLSDLLEISRHDAGVAELSVESEDLRLTVESALENVGHLAKDASVDLVVDMPTEAVIAEVDPRRVERILRNLIANAIDHAERKPVRIRMAADEDTVAVTVRDYGVGLRPGEEKLVFSRFWRSDPSRVRRSGGTGLGLAISIEDARLHQGRLEAWGEPGKGACFRLTLPLVRGHKVTDKSAAAQADWRPTARARRRVTANPRGSARETRAGGGLAAGWSCSALTGCAGVPSSSAPQAIGTVDRPAPPSLPTPTPGMDPDLLLREFLKATADPANRHLAARQFLTQSASAGWDDAGSALLIDRVVFVETRGPERVSVTMRGRHPRLAVRRRRVRDRRGRTARPRADRTGQDPRRVAHRQAAQRRLPRLAAVPGRPTSATRCTSSTPPARPSSPTRGTSRWPTPTSWPPNWSPSSSPALGPRWPTPCAICSVPPLRLRGPVTRADGGKTGVGRGYGGARIELENLSTTDPHSRQLLAAQIIWTLSRAGINGPYVINADGAALDDRFVDGWNTSDVAATDPGADPGAPRVCTP